jgi:hypothetical protein
MEMGNARFHMGNQEKQLPISIQTTPYGNGDCCITIWKWGILVSIWGIKKYGSQNSYGDPHMETGISTSPYANGECPFLHGESLLMTPCFHAGIPIWKQGLTHHHMEMGNACFHMGNHKKWLPVSIQGSPHGNGDQHFPIWKWGMPVSIWGIIRNGSPFPLRDSHMETGINTSLYGNGECLFLYG